MKISITSGCTKKLYEVKQSSDDEKTIQEFFKCALNKDISPVFKSIGIYNENHRGLNVTKCSGNEKHTVTKFVSGDKKVKGYILFTHESKNKKDNNIKKMQLVVNKNVKTPNFFIKFIMGIWHNYFENYKENIQLIKKNNEDQIQKKISYMKDILEKDYMGSKLEINTLVDKLEEFHKNNENLFDDLKYHIKNFEETSIELNNFKNKLEEDIQFLQNAATKNTLLLAVLRTLKDNLQKEFFSDNFFLYINNVFIQLKKYSPQNEFNFIQNAEIVKKLELKTIEANKVNNEKLNQYKIMYYELNKLYQ